MGVPSPEPSGRRISNARRASDPGIIVHPDAVGDGRHVVELGEELALGPRQRDKWLLAMEARSTRWLFASQAAPCRGESPVARGRVAPLPNVDVEMGVDHIHITSHRLGDGGADVV